MRRFLYLTWSFLKVFWRDRGSVFFTFLMPVVITAIFGLLNFGTFGTVRVGMVDDARNAASARLSDGLRDVSALRVSTGSLDEELRALRRGQRDLVVVFPADFAPSTRGDAVVTVYENAGQPVQVGVGRTILTQVIDRVSFAALGVQPIARLDTRPIDARNQTYVDFLLPGMIAFSVMQLGVFSVAFGIVNAKRTGWLRRLMATPLPRSTFLGASVLFRLVNVLLQVVVLTGLGAAFFRYRPIGNLAEVTAIALLGGAVFLTFGFAVAGWARSEDQAAPLANLIALPQAFLSGVWFGRESLPQWLRPIAEFFPLSFLADGLREVSAQGAHLWDLPVQLLGLAVWGIVGFALAVRLFRFE